MIRNALFDERHDLGAARVTGREFVARILAERLHPLADGSLGVAEALQDRIHPPLELTQLVEAALVDLVGTHGRRSRSLERPTVIFVAMRPRRHARGLCGEAALQLQLGNLPFERRSDLLLDGCACPLGPVAGNILFPGPPLDRFDQAPALGRALPRLAQLGERLVDQESGGNEALAPRHGHALELIVELLGI